VVEAKVKGDPKQRNDEKRQALNNAILDHAKSETAQDERFYLISTARLQ